MLSRVSKGSARPFVDPFNDFTSWNDGRSCLKRGTPLSLTDSLIRQYINPTFSRFLFRASKEKKKKELHAKGKRCFPYFPFFSFPIPIQNSREEYAISNDFVRKKKTRRESRNDLIVETWQESDLRKRRRIRSNRVSWAGFTSLEKKKKKRTAIQFAVRISKRR